MSKRQRPSLQGTVKPAHSHNSATTRQGDDVVVQLRDDDVPEAVPDDALARIATEAHRHLQARHQPAAAVIDEPAQPSQPATRSSRGRAKPVEEDVKDYAHRSLYARPETFEIIRQMAHDKRVSAQALYREGLFLMLRKHGRFDGKTEDDV